MKILIIGGKGTIGKTVTNYFSRKHEVIVAGRNSGNLNVDISSTDSIRNMFEKTGKIDAIIVAAGEAKWAAFTDMTEDDFHIGLNSKLMGQVNVVRYGIEYLNKNGSITLTTGILADDPVVLTSSAAMVNGAIHSFVKAVQLEMTQGIRINAVSPGLVADAVEKYREYFPGHNAVSMEKALSGYIKSVEGKISGEVVRLYD